MSLWAVATSVHVRMCVCAFFSVDRSQWGTALIFLAQFLTEAG